MVQSYPSSVAEDHLTPTGVNSELSDIMAETIFRAISDSDVSTLSDLERTTSDILALSVTDPNAYAPETTAAAQVWQAVLKTAIYSMVLPEVTMAESTRLQLAAYQQGYFKAPGAELENEEVGLSLKGYITPSVVNGRMFIQPSPRAARRLEKDQLEIERRS